MVITDARVLREDFLPREMVHRDAELDQLSNALAPLVDGEEPADVLIHGPSGAGKTALARYTLRELEGEALDLRHQYVNCWEDYNRYKTLYRALEGLGKTLDVHRQSTPKDELLTRLRRHDEPYVLVLDEVDQLEEQEVLYDLYGMEHVHMVMIANDEADVFAGMDERIRSRLMGCRRIGFSRYGLAELVDILADRAEWGLHPDAVDEPVLEDIADAAAGDARLAIAILRSAARRAEEERVDAITPELVEAAVPDAEQQERQKNVEKLNDHQKAVYDVLVEAGPLGPGELYDRYADAVEEPRTERTVRKYVNKMEHYNLVETDGERKGKTIDATQD
ncbi:MAG: Cdc6/Cdc18 family protein [Candidatus Nanohaloarchaea archaeon]|nr:Cdc6/Cdc18 family protein [Candidatus Nanohaloarchaea archaeon]